jgi:hypothetical protein
MSYGGGGETMNELTQDDCKLITEKLLGEKWHKWIDDKGMCACGHYHSPTADLYGGKLPSYMNRTFQAPQDFFACFEKLVELGEWDEFEWWSIQRQPIGSVSYIQWLLSRTESGEFRLCQLVAEWLTAQKEGV